MPTSFTEARHAAEFLASEAAGNRSREVITVLSGQVLKAGHVLGQITKATTATPAAVAGNTDGSESAVAVLLDAVDATGADKDSVAIARDAEVKSGALEWFFGATSNQKTTGEGELKANAGIIAR